MSDARYVNVGFVRDAYGVTHRMIHLMDHMSTFPTSFSKVDDPRIRVVWFCCDSIEPLLVRYDYADVVFVRGPVDCMACLVEETRSS